MALRRAKQAGHEICALLTMFSPENGTSRSHGLPRQLLTDQANALGLALHVGYAGWSDYEREFKRCLSALVSDGIELAVFGDIFLDDHRHWVERVCSEAGCEALEPLWGEATDRLLEETIAAGIRAHVCTVRPEHVAPSWLGAALDQGFLQSCGGGRIDPCGEHGEYHTVVLAAPDFRHQIIVDSAQVRDDTDHSHWHIRSWRTAPSGAIAARSRPTVSLGPAPPGLLRNKSKGSNESIPQATGRLFTDDECGLLEEIIFHRRDVRGNRFTKREISDQAIDRVLNAALRAPSVGFSQPWRFVVVRDPAIKLRVREDFERENLKAASHFDDSRRDLYARLKLEGITEAPVNIAVFYKKSEEAVLGQTSVDEVGPYSAVCAIQNMWPADKSAEHRDGVGQHPQPF